MLFAIPGLSRNIAKELADLARIVGSSAGSGLAEDLRGDHHNLAISHATPVGNGSHEVAKIDTGVNRGAYSCHIFGSMYCDGIAFPINMNCVIIPTAAAKLQIFGVYVNSPCWKVTLNDASHLSITLDKTSHT